MHGTIIGYDNEEEMGVIRGEDQKIYTLSIVDCRSIIKPNVNFEVNFEPNADKATEIYVISQEVAPIPSRKSPSEPTHHQTKKSTFTFLPLVIFISVVGLITVLIYGELDRRNMEEVQNTYHAQIKKIETLLKSKNCDEAAREYTHAQETRDKLFKMGLYYSLDSHAKQAHAIEIAECYAHQNEFDKAIGMLDIKTIHEPDYLLRASVIYRNSGDTLKADEAKAIADKFVPL